MNLKMATVGKINEDMYEAIANIMLQSVSGTWSCSQREKWTNAFIQECKEYSAMPGFIHFTRERMHSTVVHACYEINTNVYDFYASPMYVPAIFYVHDYNHFSYRPEGLPSVDVFL